MSVPERASPWQRLWFDAEHPATLTFVRWIVFTSVAANAWVARRAVRQFPERAEVLWDPISLLGAVNYPRPSPLVVEVLLAAAILGSIATLVRIAPRWTGLVGATAYLTIVMMENSFGKISHGKQPLVVMAVVLALAPIPWPDAPRSWRWHWPVQLCRAVLAITLAAAAFSKLQRSGLEWVLSENMRNVLVMESLVLRNPALPDVAQWIASEPWRWKAAAAGAVLGEASMICALGISSSRLRAVFVISGAATVAGITLLMDLIGFPIVLLCAIFASPRTVIDGVARGVPLLRLLAPALVGMAALAVVLTLHSGRPSLHVAPLAVGAVVLVATMWSARRAVPPAVPPAVIHRRRSAASLG